MGLIGESGQLFIGATFLLIACLFFLFSVHDIALGWRDRVKLQQVVDAALLSSGSIMADVLTLMDIFNVVSLYGYFKDPRIIAIGQSIDALRMVIEKLEIVGLLTGILGADTHYVIHVDKAPSLDAKYNLTTNRFDIGGGNPGNRVARFRGWTSSISKRYLLKRFMPQNYQFKESIITVTGEVGIFRQGGLILRTYVPVLMR